MGAAVTIKLTATEFDGLREAVKHAMGTTFEEGCRLQKEIEDPSTDPRTVHSAKEMLSVGQRNYRRWEQVLNGPLG